MDGESENQHLGHDPYGQEIDEQENDPYYNEYELDQQEHQ